MAMWAELAQLIAGAVTGAVGAGVTGAMKDQAYASALQQTQAAANRYTGKNAYASMTNEGQSTAMQEQAANNAMQNMSMGNGTKMSNAQFDKGTSANAALSGFGSGMSNASNRNAANYGLATTQADQLLKQKEKETGAVNEGMVGASNAAGGLMNLIGQTKGSDERLKEGPNNRSGLPRADIQDSLRQLETILYQYKDPSIEGCDSETHVGTTAQSMEQTPLFEDAVQNDSDGFKKVDEWKLLESIEAAEAELQREIDKLEKGEVANE